MDVAWAGIGVSAAVLYGLWGLTCAGDPELVVSVALLVTAFFRLAAVWSILAGVLVHGLGPDSRVAASAIGEHRTEPG